MPEPPMLISAAPLDAASERTYTISQLAEEFGVTARTVRFYEDQGLLAPRREGLSRIYSHRDRARLALICRGKRLGFSLAEIKDFLDLYEVDDRQVEQMKYLLERGRERRRSLERQLEDARQTIGELSEIEAQIARHLRDLDIDPDKIR